MMHIMNSLPVCGLFLAESREIKDFDGKSTEEQGCGFGELNRMLRDGGQVGDHGRN
jgi:hypothetical protein